MSTNDQSDAPITAADMGRLSWSKRSKGKTPEQISRAMKKLAKGRMKLTPERRSEIAAMGGAARAGKKRKPGGGRPKKAAKNPEK